MQVTLVSWGGVWEQGVKFWLVESVVQCQASELLE
jgi:hypothetical protein